MSEKVYKVSLSKDHWIALIQILENSSAYNTPLDIVRLGQLVSVIEKDPEETKTLSKDHWEFLKKAWSAPQNGSFKGGKEFREVITAIQEALDNVS